MSAPETKDIRRLEDIKAKSGFDIEKAISLAHSMANKITDRNKAQRRQLAADEIFGKDSQISKIFQQRFLDLDPDEIKRGELIDKIFKAFDFRDNGVLTELDGVECKIELNGRCIQFFEHKKEPSHIINNFAESYGLPPLSEMWINRHLFEPYDKTDTGDFIKYEFSL
jgi:hypothetical protein